MNQRYGFPTADGPVTLVLCDHCAKTTTRLKNGDPVDEPCDECGYQEPVED